MINSVAIHNFKLFKDVEQKLGHLTLLTGLNGRGKSTFLQSILTAHFTLKEGHSEFFLDNEYVKLGCIEDILPWYLDDLKVGLTLTIDGVPYKLTSKDICASWTKEDAIPLADDESNIKRFVNLPMIQYLAAGRMHSTDIFPTASLAAKRKSLSIRYGDGMATARFLYEYGNQPIPLAALSYPGCESLSILNQANAWLKAISPDLNVHVQLLGNNFQLRYSSVNLPGVPNITANASNVGYGITYALPLITAILSSSSGDVVIIETPEAHIHPAGQARLMDLCALAAANGIQVILETHSDHIVNGLLRNVKSDKISREDVKVLFFDKKANEDAPHIYDLEVTSNGRILAPRKNFFDQYRIDLRALL